jgi:heat shock protein HslJ
MTPITGQPYGTAAMSIRLPGPRATLLALQLAACTTIPAMAASPLEGTAWVLAAPAGTAPPAAPAPTLQFADGKVQGSDGCNRYSFPYMVHGRTVQMTAPGVSTLMACPPGLAEQARNYMAALTATRAYRIDARQLVLLAADDSVTATLDPQATSLAGSHWRVTAVNNGRQAVASVIAGSDLTLQFGTDGRVSGSAGCNRFSATYAEADGKVSFAPAAATRRMCGDNALMAQEQAFLKALATVAAARFEGDRLELRTAAGALAVAALRDVAR